MSLKRQKEEKAELTQLRLGVGFHPEGLDLESAAAAAKLCTAGPSVAPSDLRSQAAMPSPK